MLGFGAMVVLVIVFLFANDSSRAWIEQHKPWVFGGLVIFLLIGSALLSVVFLKQKSDKVRAAVLVMVGYPLLGLLVGSTVFVLPARWQLVVIRSLLLVILVISPAAMWWLFLATQRASLLNEFLSNLRRLGLLDDPGNLSLDARKSRAVRIGGYLQRFEATYGRLPEWISRDVVGNPTGSYSREELRVAAESTGSGSAQATADGSPGPYTAENVQGRTPLAIAAVPVSMVVIVLAVGWLVTLPPVPGFPVTASEPRWLLAFSPNLTPVTLAFLGAYFYSLQMLFRRYVRGDLRGSAYMAVLIRIILAIVSVWVLTTIRPGGLAVDSPELLALAFVIGVFPLVIWQVLRGITAKIFTFALPNLVSSLDLSQLDGLTVWHQSRLEEEDIENVPNMATADIVDLLVNTRIPANRVIDWVDQAILLTHLVHTDDTDKPSHTARRTLLKYGVRTATSLVQVSRQAAWPEARIADEAAPDYRSLVAAMLTNPNLELVARWRDVAVRADQGAGPPGQGSGEHSQQQVGDG